MTRYAILKNGQTVTTTSNSLDWCEAVYPVADGYVIRLDDPCTCSAGNICDTCYARAYSNLYAR